MGKKKKASRSAPRAASENGRRKRRSAEEMIQDLRTRIQEIETRATARELKKSPSMGKMVTLVRNIDKALAFAEEEGNTAARHVLADARAPLAQYLVSQGMTLPRARLPKGRRPADAQYPS